MSEKIEGKKTLFSTLSHMFSSDSPQLHKSTLAALAQASLFPHAPNYLRNASKDPLPPFPFSSVAIGHFHLFYLCCLHGFRGCNKEKKGAKI